MNKSPATEKGVFFLILLHLCVFPLLLAIVASTTSAAENPDPATLRREIADCEAKEARFRNASVTLKQYGYHGVLASVAPRHSKTKTSLGSLPH